MTSEEFLKQQFITLRDEISQTKRRMFFIILLGTVLVLVSSFVVDLGQATFRPDEGLRTSTSFSPDAQRGPSCVWGGARTSPAFYASLGTAAVPYVVVLLILFYVAEQNAILRCGRYIKEHIEPKIADTVGWERWLETQPGMRRIDKAFLASFLVIFLIYYFVSVGVAANALASAFGETWSVTMATACMVPYVIGGLWAFIIAARHWHAMTRTTD